MLEQVRSTGLIEEDIAILNSQTIAARILREEVLLDYIVIRVNCLYKEVNLIQLETFAKKRN